MNNQLQKYILFIFILASQSALSQKKTFSTAHPDTSKITKVGIVTLLNNISAYEGKWVETEGYVAAIFESFFLTTTDEKVKFTLKGIPAIWLELDTNLKVHIPFFNGKILQIKGQINTKWKGHMNQYQGVIQNIYFIKEI